MHKAEEIRIMKEKEENLSPPPPLISGQGLQLAAIQTQPIQQGIFIIYPNNMNPYLSQIF
jgi:hypothetical protein